MISGPARPEREDLVGVGWLGFNFPDSKDTRLKHAHGLLLRPVVDDVYQGATLQNLLSNAVTHAQEGEGVTLEALPQMLTVRNPAPNPQTADLERIFERFW
jgi:hypothetical protein